MIMNNIYKKLIVKMLLAPLLLLAITGSAMAGVYPYAEFQTTVWKAVRDILNDHGMPVPYDRENPWFWNSARPGSYTIILYRADEIPQEAVMDIVRLCIDLYEQRGRKERFRIKMYRESFEEKRRSLFLGIGGLTRIKPYFEFTIGRVER